VPGLLLQNDLERPPVDGLRQLAHRLLDVFNMLTRIHGLAHHIGPSAC